MNQPQPGLHHEWALLRATVEVHDRLRRAGSDLDLVSAYPGMDVYEAVKATAQQVTEDELDANLKVYRRYAKS